MKQLFTAMTIAIMCFACTDQQVHLSEPTRFENVQPPQIEIRKSLSDVFINSSTFCDSWPGSNCAEQTYGFQAQFMKLDPIPVPQSGLGPIISTTEAVKLYNQFVTDHAGEPLLTVFRQLYPRILLNKYGVITSRNYPLVTYFVRELIESGSYDFATQANGLKAIQAHLPASEFSQLVRLAITNTRHFKPLHRQIFDRVMADLDNPGVDLRMFPEDTRKQIRTSFIEENKVIIQAIAHIEQLQVVSVDQIR